MLYPLYVYREQLADQEEERARIEAALSNYLSGIARDLEQVGATVRCAVHFGSPAEEILAYAARHNIELIAMCTHGRSGLGRWALGSITDKILRESDIPVLTVRAKQKAAKK